MDALELFGEMYPTGNGSDSVLDLIRAPEEEFLNLIETADDMEDLGLSLLDNYDLVDIMTPMFATPFSPVPCDNMEFMNTNYQHVHQQIIEHEKPETSAYISPLKQLLLSSPKTSSQYSHTTQDTKPLPASSKQSGRRTSERKSKALKMSIDNSESQANNPYAASYNSHSPMKYDKNLRSSKDEKSKCKVKVVSKALKFPPCLVCGGKASGLHYGVNTCEACKGFFRRYIIRNEEYKCAKEGNCKVVNKNRENCSGCRLRKCLALGMSKENSKLGRYSLSRRTETIKQVNVLEGKDCNDTNHFNLDSFKFDHTYSEVDNGNTSSHDSFPEDYSPDSLLQELVRKMDAIQPFGPNITTNEQAHNVIMYHHQRYQSKLQTYGEMKAVPREEYYKLLKEYGIDIDGRIQQFKEYILKLERLTERYYNFAQQIPGFKKLQSRDQSNLLNAFRIDFFIILMHECYNEEYGIILARNGVAYHIDELADKCFSRKLITLICDVYARFQRLSLSKEEKCLLMALTLTFSDRCSLADPDFVDKIQYRISEVMRYQLERTVGPLAHQRFAKCVDCLVFLREASEQYMTELKQLCNDEIMIKEIPMMAELLIDD